ncbi:MAG: cell wall hydrolase [Clostridia bacterium]|nr:cell wall hydrolase [Clostridia bacterium]
MKRRPKRRQRIRLCATLVSVFLAISCMAALPAGATGSGAAESYETETARAFSMPSGAYRINLNVNGRRVLEGRVFNFGGVTYVPMFKFADWLGVFDYSSSVSGSRRTSNIDGENLEISATENNLYIRANGRYFYTGGEVLEIGNELYVPILPMVKALNSRVSWSNTENAFAVSSGDTRRLKNADQVYSSDAVYWLSRIINAEAGGESMKGKIAVGNVVLNRVRSKQFPNTIYGVIFDKKYGVQFAPTANGMIYKAPNADSVIAAKMCLEGYSISNEALYFFNPKYTSGTWVKQNRDYLFTIGNHVFYN